jgi:hypothetical protein
VEHYQEASAEELLLWLTRQQCIEDYEQLQ